MTAPIKQSSFSAGEISPFMYGRTDNVKYETGLRTMRNFLAMRHGGATNRPGTQYISATLNTGNALRLIPFIFNETGIGQSYVLEFGNQYIAFYQNGGIVTLAGNAYTVVSPYVQADLQNLKFAQSADVLTITHPSYAPRELKRAGATNWTLTAITTGATIASPTGFSANTGPTIPPLQSMTYFVTAISATNGEESEPTRAFYTFAVGGLPTEDLEFSFQWSAVTGASYYRVYKGYGSVPAGAGGGAGFVASTATTTFTDRGNVPDFTNTPPILNSLFASTDNYPATVGFTQQRRGFANTNNNPVGFWLSQPGLYSNFDFRSVPVDSDAVIGAIAGQEVNSIENIIELKFMLMLSAGAEIYIQGNGSGVVTPAAINASTQSQYGCGVLRPLRVSETVIFNQALGSFIRDLAFDFATEGYRGNDLTVFASHLFEGHQIVDWDFQKIPDSIVWAVRDDGVLLGLTYMREQQVLAWHRHDFTNGFVENVCCIPENGNYATYLSIKRVINGATVRYIERMSSRIWSDVINATYLDCFSTYNGVNQTAATMTLTGNFVQDGTAYQQNLTLTCSANVFAANMVGNQIFLSDQAFLVNTGNMVDPNNSATARALSTSGNLIRCTIIAYISATQVTVTPNRAVPTTLQSTAVATWARAVSKLTGLSYLAGQNVSVWADRFVVASANNTNVTFQATIASDGSLTLDKCYAVIYVGLPMTSDLETLDRETAYGETEIGKRKRQNKLYSHFYNTRTFFAGSQDPSSNRDNTNNDPTFEMEELKTGTSRDDYDDPPSLLTTQDYIIEVSQWNKNGRIFIRSVDPVPVTILAIVPGGDSPSQNPVAERV